MNKKKNRTEQPLMSLHQKQPRIGHGNGRGFEYLCKDLVINILRRLNAEQLWWSCRKVCTKWNDVISSLYFRQLHLQQPSPSTVFAFYLLVPTWKWPRKRNDNNNLISFFPPDHFFSVIPRDDPMRRSFNGSLVQHWKHQMGGHVVYPVASCDGLVLFRIESSFLFQFYIGNPITGELMTVEYPYKGAEFHGFFYHSSTQLYKVLLCHRTEDESNPFEYVILNLGSTKWRTLRAVPYCAATESSSPVILDKTLYWMIDQDYSACENSIMMFSMDTEDFRTMAHPSYPCQTTEAHEGMRLSEMEGRLACWFFLNLGVRVWVFEDDHIGGHWTQTYDILDISQSFKSYISPHGQYNSKKELLSIRNKEALLLWRGVGMFHYNLSTNTVEKIEVEGFDDGKILLTNYTKTLVSLKNFYPFFSKLRN